MYNWYRDAKACYAYLSDIDISDQSTTDEDQLRLQLAQARWFSRGWTLQELIAPTLVQFYTAGWKPLKTKSEMCTILSQISGIDEFVLNGNAPLQSFSVAQRMSWAAPRRTTRIEDEAYCLLGLFDVQLPLLYGEGHNAFLRLQEEIIRTNDDQSIFAWQDDTPRYNTEEFSTGLLAHSARDFKTAGDIYSPCSSAMSAPSTINIKRLRIEFPMILVHEPIYMAVLNCARHGKLNGAVTIQLERIYKDRFRRRGLFRTGVTDIRHLEQWNSLAIFAPISGTTVKSMVSSRTTVELHLPYQGHSNAGFRLAAVHPRERWDSSVLKTWPGWYAAFMFERHMDNFVIIAVPHFTDKPTEIHLFCTVAITQRHGESTLEEFIEVSGTSSMFRVSGSNLKFHSKFSRKIPAAVH